MSHTIDPTTLPPYSMVSTCEKCGDCQPETVYVEGVHCVHELFGDFSVVHAGDTNGPHEWMHRTCRHCRFQWDEGVTPPAASTRR